MSIPLPKNIKFEDVKDNSATLVIEPLYPGYGTTVGNLLRRVLISSLEGVAVERVKIEGLTHEFTTIDYVKEDVVDIILNIKQIRIKAKTKLTEPVEMTLDVQGEKEVKAGDIQTPGDIEIVNPDLHIATVTDQAGSLRIVFTVGAGIGYVTVEQRDNKTDEVGVIEVDSIYSPIVRVGMNIENVRVDKMTNFDKLLLNIVTDGTRTPQEAVQEAIDIIQSHINLIDDNIK